ncbi:MAG: hypothetical protein QOD39_365 [Mycobacterium sp.]|jgi:hypothetical protein|nr:hypothetical protein [Mycobacterium sp.]
MDENQTRPEAPEAEVPDELTEPHEDDLRSRDERRPDLGDLSSAIMPDSMDGPAKPGDG